MTAWHDGAGVTAAVVILHDVLARTGAAAPAGGDA